MTIYFDLSTSARWSGHAVGIVRTEAELARRLRRFADDAGGYCIYVPNEGRFRLLPDDKAEEILAGRLVIDFQEAPAGLTARPTLRRRIRDLILSRPRLYQTIQRLRGLSFSLEQIAEVRRSETALVAVNCLPAMRQLDEVASEPLHLAPDVLIISGGLDWEHKNMRALYRLKKASGFKYAAIIYDLIPILYPQYVVPAYVNLLRDYFGELFWVVDYALSISQRTELDMLEYCASIGVKPPLSAHFPLGSDLSKSAMAEAELPEALHGKKFALFVSTIEPRKNHRILYQAWERALRQGRIDPQECRLVFVGMQGWNTGDFLNELSANPITNTTIIRLSGISDAELRALYQQAEFSVFPSIYEGYGLPVAESLGYGCPCICSNTGSLPEIAGDLVQYVDPGDPIAWMDAMAAAFAAPEELRAQRELIKTRFHAISWDNAAGLFFTKLQGVMARAEA